MIEYKVEREIKVIGDKGKALNVVKWGDHTGKLDIRTWIKSKEEVKPGKGLTLTDEEGKQLLEGLQEYFA